MNKRESTLAHKMVVLSLLLQECLDELNPTTQKMIDLRNTLLQFVDELNEELQGTEAMVKHTYFQELSNKVDSIMRNNFNPNM